MTFNGIEIQGKLTFKVKNSNVMGLWQVVAMDSLKFHPGRARHALLFYALQAATPETALLPFQG
jgi:hypothetical protein